MYKIPVYVHPRFSSPDREDIIAHAHYSSILATIIFLPPKVLQNLKTEGLTEMFGEYNFDDMDSDDEVPERADRRSAIRLRC